MKRSSKASKSKGKSANEPNDGTLAGLTDFSQYKMPRDPESPRPHNSGGSSETTGEYRKIPHIRKGDKDKATRVRQISNLDSSGNSANNSSENSANNSSGNNSSGTSAINSSENNSSENNSSGNSAANSSGPSAANSSGNSAANSSGPSAANSSGNSAANSSGNSAVNSSGNSAVNSGENSGQTSAGGSGGNSATGSSGNSASNLVNFVEGYSGQSSGSSSAGNGAIARFKGFSGLSSDTQSSPGSPGYSGQSSGGQENSSGGNYGSLTDSSPSGQSATGSLSGVKTFHVNNSPYVSTKKETFRAALKFSYSEGFLKELKGQVEFVEFTRVKSCPEIPIINLTTKEGSHFCIVNTVTLGMCIVGTQHNQFDLIKTNSTESYISARRSQTGGPGPLGQEKEKSLKGKDTFSETSSLNYRHVLSQASLGTDSDRSRRGSDESGASLHPKGINTLNLRARPPLRFSSSSDLEIADESMSQSPLSPVPSLLDDAISAVYEKHPDKFYESMHALLQDVSPSYSEKFCSELTRRLCKVQDERGEPREYID